MSPAAQESGWIDKFRFWLTEEPEGREEVRGYCPAHEVPGESKTPSASFNFGKGVVKCFSRCGKGYTLNQMYEIVRQDVKNGDTPAEALPSAAPRSINSAPSKRKQQKLPSEKEIRQWRKNLREDTDATGVLLKERGLTQEILERAEIGYGKFKRNKQWEYRYTIPVRDTEGELVNVRLYKPGADSAKMINIYGHGSATLYGVEALDQKEIFLTEGEMDRLCGMAHGLNTMTHTSGAKSWNSKWSPLFEGKIVYVVYDCDGDGRAGAKRTAHSLQDWAEAVFIVRLPLPGKGDSKDLTDYFVGQSNTREDFQEVLESPASERQGTKRELAAPIGVTLEHSMNADFANTPIHFRATLAGKIQPPYMLPRTASLGCSMDWGNKCNSCNLHTWNGGKDIEIPANDFGLILEMVNSPKDRRYKAVLKSKGIQPNCPKVEWQDKKQWTVEELIVVPSIDDRGEEAQTPLDRRVYNVGEYKTPINTTVQLVGVNTADPKDARSILQTWESRPTKTDLDKFEVTPDILQKLSVFRTKNPIKKMRKIAEDLSANVTHIYGRPELHMAYDLVWHSVMDFTFKGARVGKGWLELLVMGDTRTGKSEVAQRLTEHYRAGILKSCEGISFAGLVGGAQQRGTQWTITWGVIPLQDRRLVVLDEVSGMGDKGIIEQMSSVRSSGRAQITKIAQQETSARTRLIWLSNPVDGTTIAEMSRGAIDGIQKLVKNPEDIARFDLAMAVTGQDVASSLINDPNPPQVPHKFSKESCSLLVTWAWSRKAEDVWWDEGTEDYVLECAEKLGKVFVSEPPLLQAENIRVKLARISAAIAARCFSTDDSGEKLLIDNSHVDAAMQMIRLLYGAEHFGYLQHSRREIQAKREAERNKKICRRYLMSNDGVLETLKFVIDDTAFKVRDFEEFGGMHSEEARAAISELMKMRMVKRMSKGYIKMQPVLTDIVKQLKSQEEE